MREGSTTPSVHMTAPPMPATSCPAYVAMLTANGPGVLSDMAMKSSRTSWLSQPLATISSMMSGIIACPPPMVKSPILKKVQNSCSSSIVLSLLHCRPAAAPGALRGRRRPPPPFPRRNRPPAAFPLPAALGADSGARPVHDVTGRACAHCDEEFPPRPDVRPCDGGDRDADGPQHKVDHVDVRKRGKAEHRHGEQHRHDLLFSFP